MLASVAMSHTCMRGLVGDSTITRAVLPGCTAADTFLQQRVLVMRITQATHTGNANQQARQGSIMKCARVRLCFMPYSAAHMASLAADGKPVLPPLAVCLCMQHSCAATCGLPNHFAHVAASHATVALVVPPAAPGVSHVHVGDLQPEAGRDALQEAGGAAIQVVARDDVLPRRGQPHHRPQRRHAACKRKCAVAALAQQDGIRGQSPTSCQVVEVYVRLGRPTVLLSQATLPASAPTLVVAK